MVVEVGRNGAKELVEDLELKLRKAQRDITTLRAEHIAATGLLEQMASDVSSLRKQDEDLHTRSLRTKDDLAGISTTTDTVTTLVEELRAQNAAARRYTYAPRPSFASDTSLDEQPFSHGSDSASSSRSQSFAEACPEPRRIEVPFSLRTAARSGCANFMSGRCRSPNSCPSVRSLLTMNDRLLSETLRLRVRAAD